MHLKVLKIVLIGSFSLLAGCKDEIPVEPCLIDVPNNACYCITKKKKVKEHPLSYCDGHISYNPQDNRTLLDKCKRAAEKPKP